MEEHCHVDPLCEFTHSERDFQVLSTPDVHACVICADLLEIIPVYGEQTTCHGRSPAKEQTAEQVN